MQKRIHEGEVLENKSIASGIMKMVIAVPEAARLALPGQFVNIYMKSESLILPRPISICDADAKAGTITIVYDVVGRGTAELARAGRGDIYRMTDPLGNGFDISAFDDASAAREAVADAPASSVMGASGAAPGTVRPAGTGETGGVGTRSAAPDTVRPAGAGEAGGVGLTKGAPAKACVHQAAGVSDVAGARGAARMAAAACEAILVGGGVGCAPMVFLAKALKKRGVRCTAVAGFRKEPFLIDELREADARVVVTTDIPTENAFVGTVVDAMQINDIRGDAYFACGPRAMLAALSKYIYGIEPDAELQVSMEERMGCGYGACVGCVCDTRRVDTGAGGKSAGDAMRLDVGATAGAAYKKKADTGVSQQNGERPSGAASDANQDTCASPDGSHADATSGEKPADTEIIKKKVCKDGPVFKGNEVIW